MTRYDLSKEGVDYLRLVTRFRWFTLAFTVFAVVAIGYLAVRWELADDWTRLNLESVAALAVIAGAFSAVTWMLAPSAVALEVDSAGVRFEYPGGRVRRLAWEDPRFRLMVDHTTGAVDSISVGRPIRLAADRRAFQDFLTRPAFEAILDGSRRNGLTVSEKPSPRRGWIRSVISHESSS